MRPVKTPKRGPKKPGRHQWHYVRPGGGQNPHRRVQGIPGMVICLRRDCRALKLAGTGIDRSACPL